MPFAAPRIETAHESVVRQIENHLARLERQGAVNRHADILERATARQRRLKALDKGLVAKLREIAMADD